MGDCERIHLLIPHNITSLLLLLPLLLFDLFSGVVLPGPVSFHRQYSVDICSLPRISLRRAPGFESHSLFDSPRHSLSNCNKKPSSCLLHARSQPFCRLRLRLTIPKKAAMLPWVPVSLISQTSWTAILAWANLLSNTAERTSPIYSRMRTRTPTLMLRMKYSKILWLDSSLRESDECCCQKPAPRPDCASPTNDGWHVGFSKDFYLEQIHRPRHYKGGESAPLFGNFL